MQPQRQQQRQQPPLPHVFVGVLSGSHNLAARQAIRQTWGSDPRLSTVVFFVLRPRTLQGVHSLREEAAQHGDIVVTSDILESYYNCTHSVVSMLRAAAALGNSIDYLIKTDDDAYLRVGLLLEGLSHMPRQWLYSGHGMRPVPTPRDGTWAIPFDAWPHPMTPPYSYGLGYVLSADLVRHLAAGALHAAMPNPDILVPIEDIAVGIATEALSRWQGASVTLDTSLSYSLTGCSEQSAFVQLPRLQYNMEIHTDVMYCMHSTGRCCGLDAFRRWHQQQRQQQWQH